MEKWAKIFYVHGEAQLLATKNFDQDETIGLSKVNFTTRLKGTEIEMSIYSNNIDAFFEDVDQRMAEQIYNQLIQ